MEVNCKGLKQARVRTNLTVCLAHGPHYRNLPYAHSACLGLDDPTWSWWWGRKNCKWMHTQRAVQRETESTKKSCPSKYYGTAQKQTLGFVWELIIALKLAIKTVRDFRPVLDTVKLSPILSLGHETVPACARSPDKFSPQVKNLSLVHDYGKVETKTKLEHGEQRWNIWELWWMQDWWTWVLEGSEQWPTWVFGCPVTSIRIFSHA